MEIILLTKQNYVKYISVPSNIVHHPNFHDFPARFADCLRCCILAKYEGVWLDASFLVHTHFDEWFSSMTKEDSKYEFIGFYIESFTTKKQFPIIENWFLACTPQSRFMTLWKNEFLNIHHYSSVSDYVHSRKIMGVDLQKLFDPVYLAMHVAVQKILQIDHYPLKTLRLFPAEKGPFLYLHESQWDSFKGLQLACQNPSKYQFPFIKLRGIERDVLQKNPSSSLSCFLSTT